MNALKTWLQKTRPRSRRPQVGVPLRVSEADYYRLMNLVNGCKKRKCGSPRRLLFLRRILSNAQIVPLKLVSADVVTMNSAMLLRTAGGEALQCRLVYPDEQSKLNRQVSVLSWLGLSLLGKQPGAALRCGLTLESVLYQPEINSHWHL
ncbi:MAG: hypothetical protein LLF76_09845 [Planctomycetaceae bacterium]|nr:hypothetical protein [Planctomycetaceae bacterium]